MILVLDNYDSFTYNLVHYIGECGKEVLVVRNDEISVDEIDHLNPKKIVVSPGPCTPAEAGISLCCTAIIISGFSFKTPVIFSSLGKESFSIIRLW